MLSAMQRLLACENARCRATKAAWARDKLSQPATKRARVQCQIDACRQSLVNVIVTSKKETESQIVILKKQAAANAWARKMLKEAESTLRKLNQIQVDKLTVKQLSGVVWA